MDNIYFIFSTLYISLIIFVYISFRFFSDNILKNSIISSSLTSIVFLIYGIICLYNQEGRFNPDAFFSIVSGFVLSFPVAVPLSFLCKKILMKKK